jgi:hypothetical protein
MTHAQKKYVILAIWDRIEEIEEFLAETNKEISEELLEIQELKAAEKELSAMEAGDE